MAGKRQHYIPRFLLRGFLADSSHEAERTWLHRAGTAARLVGIRDVGVRENFYSKLTSDAEPTLDDLITTIEREFDGDLRAVRSAPVGALIDSDLAARLVAHLVLRTAHVRAVFTQATTQILHEIDCLTADPDGLRRYLGVDSSDPSRAAVSAIDEVLKELPLGALEVPPALARRVATLWFREHFKSFHDQLQSTISQALRYIREDISRTVSRGHNKALMTADQSRWTSDLASLSWRTHSVAGAILPDCVALAREADDAFTPLLLSDRQRIDVVILPVAHDRLLVGSSTTAIDIALWSINEASASCSDSFFVSSKESDGARLSTAIGQRCSQAIGVVVSEALCDLKRRDTARANQTSSARQVIQATGRGSFAFSLTCTDFADAEKAEKLSGVLRVIVQEMSRDKPLTALDGVTFASDYSSALGKVDRGDPALPIEQSESRDYGRAVAKCVRVLRDGASKHHIVFDAVVAENLLDSDSDRCASGVHMVVSMLADVAHSAIYQDQLDKSSTPPDSVTRWTYQAISTIPGRYFAARESAFSDPKAGERYATLFRDSLASAQELIQEARLAYRLDCSLEKLLDVALRQISFVLAHAAEWLGHRDGLPWLDSYPGSSLIDQIKANGLNLWIELFGRDLRRLYEDDQFTSENVFSLGQHVERLLWTVQICPWPMEDGSLYVSVPPGDDARLLELRAADA